MKKNYRWLIFAVVLVVGLMFSNLFVHAQENIVETQETQWEYKIVFAKGRGSMKQQTRQDEPVLNALGKKGWELVAVQFSNYYFKRKITK